MVENKDNTKIKLAAVGDIHVKEHFKVKVSRETLRNALSEFENV